MPSCCHKLNPLPRPAEPRQDQPGPASPRLAKPGREYSRPGLNRSPSRYKRAAPTNCATGAFSSYPYEESNLDLRFRRPPLFPLSHRGVAQGGFEPTNLRLMRPTSTTELLYTPTCLVVTLPAMDSNHDQLAQNQSCCRLHQQGMRSSTWIRTRSHSLTASWFALNRQRNGYVVVLRVLDARIELALSP